jgi:integrase
VSGKTLERYRELLTHHVRPHLSAAALQKIKRVNLAALYGKLQRPKAEGGAGLAPRTVGHVHRLLHGIFRQAVKWDMITTNPATAAEPPRVERTEIEILAPDQIKTVIDALRDPPLYTIAVIGLATGMRRGEMAALRWGDVDLAAGRISVERSMEQTNAGVTIKAPKTKAGRRVVAIPPSVASELRTHQCKQGELRLALGLGKAGDDDLVFARPDNTPWPPDSLTAEWARAIRILELPKVTLHALRHTM